MVAGTYGGIAPVKPHDVVRHAPAVLRLLGSGAAEALRVITSVVAGVCALGTARDPPRPGSTPTSSPSTATRSPIRTRCTESGRSRAAAPCGRARWPRPTGPATDRAVGRPDTSWVYQSTACRLRVCVNSPRGPGGIGRAVPGRCRGTADEVERDGGIRPRRPRRWHTCA